jgi:hypothetical protein
LYATFAQDFKVDWTILSSTPIVKIRWWNQWEKETCVVYASYMYEFKKKIIEQMGC